MSVVTGLAAATTVLSVLCFALYLVALLQMPTGRRPTIVPRDRLGRPLPPAENPDYRDTEAEHED